MKARVLIVLVFLVAVGAIVAFTLLQNILFLLFL